MKNKLVFIFRSLLVFAFLTVIGVTKEKLSSEELHEFVGKTTTKSFDSFLIPDDWIEIERFSMNNKYFFHICLNKLVQL